MEIVRRLVWLEPINFYIDH